MMSKIVSLRAKGDIRGFAFLLILGLLVLCLALAITRGTTEIPVSTVWQAFAAFDGSADHLIVLTIRLPRALIAMLVGAALSVAGAILQGLTRNPLAEPGILGIEAGGALAVVVGISVFGTSSLSVYANFAFLGALLTAIVVYAIASLGRGGLTPLNLTVAGSALTALLASITTGILILNQSTLEEIRFWLAGSIAGRDTALLLEVFPYMAIALVIAFSLGRPITVLNLGEDRAKSLGQRTAWVKVAAAICIVLLVGSSVAVAGPIGFVGLLVPHLVRSFIKVDYRWILPYAAILGAIFLLLADLLARNLIAPLELPVGVVTAIIGSPFFIYLAKSKVKR